MKVKRRDEKQVITEAQKIYLAANLGGARRAFERFRFHWQSRYPAIRDSLVCFMLPILR